MDYGKRKGGKHEGVLIFWQERDYKQIESLKKGLVKEVFAKMRVVSRKLIW